MNAQPIHVQEILGLLLALSFGLWWVFFPGSVLGFYAWFDRGRVVLPKPFGVRLVWALWVMVVLVMTWANLKGQ